MANDVVCREVLVEWEGISREEATWEQWEVLQELFPNLNQEDKVSIKGGNINP